MDLRSSLHAIGDVSQVGEARRAAARLAVVAGLDEDAAGRAAILVTELANNLHKHAREGVILLRTVPGPRSGIEIVSVDKGPGMADVEKCFRDGFSTGGTPGTGLGAVARMSDCHEVYSQEGAGTVLVAQVLEKGRIGAVGQPHSSRAEIGSVALPVRTETVSGDNWAHLVHKNRERILVADGLGHGPLAAEASDEARRVFEERPEQSLPQVLDALHGALKKTRGAAVAIAELDFDAETAQFAGVGNIAGAILHQGLSRSMVSQNGTVGHEMRTVQCFQYPFRQGAVLVMHSDGLQSKWDLRGQPGLLMRHPSLVSALLWRDFTRGRDDVSVVVARERRQS